MEDGENLYLLHYFFLGTTLYVKKRKGHAEVVPCLKEVIIAKCVWINAAYAYYETYVFTISGSPGVVHSMHNNDYYSNNIIL